MSEQQIFQVLGLAYIAFGLGAFINPRYYRTVIAEYLKDNPAVFLNGALAIVIGYLLVTHRFSESTNWGVILKIIGALTVIKGLLIIILPKQYLVITKTLSKNMSLMTFEVVFIFVLGIVMSCVGFIR